MLMDAQNRPSNAQSLVSGTGTVVSTDSIDTLSASDMAGRNSGLRAIAVLTTAMAGAGSSVRAELIESANSNLSSPTVLATGPTMPATSGSSMSSPAPRSPAAR
jgi:hypothetical protein